MELLITTLLSWIEMHTSYRTQGLPHPEVVVLSHKELTEEYYQNTLGLGNSWNDTHLLYGNEGYENYCKKVIANSKLMAEEFIKRNYKIISGGTINHCMLIDLRNKNINGKEAEQALVQADITANKNMVPFDTQSPFITSGIRFGTPAITTRGISEKEIPKIVDLINDVIENYTNEKIIKNIKKKVNNLMSSYPIFS